MLIASLLLTSALAAAAPAAPSHEELVQILKTVDERQANNGDYKSLIYMVQKERDKADIAYEAVVYRRSEGQRLMILFLKPKSEGGKGYLRIDKNLWMYDPTTGKWERRTDRERIAGTDSRREDFDESKLAEEYDPSYVGREKLGVYGVDHLKIQAKEGVDVAFPIVELWVDAATKNVLKRQDFALSGKLMRSNYYPKWDKLYSESKGADVWFPREIHFFDELDKANSTDIAIQNVDLHSLESNLFTKAWLESKSR